MQEGHGEKRKRKKTKQNKNTEKKNQKNKTDRQKKKEVTDPYMYQNLEAVLLFSIFKPCSSSSKWKSMKKVLIFVTSQISSCGHISTTKIGWHLVFFKFQNSRFNVFIFSIFGGKGQGGRGAWWGFTGLGGRQTHKTDTLEHTNTHTKPNRYEEQRPRHDFQTVQQNEGFFMCFSDFHLQLGVRLMVKCSS